MILMLFYKELFSMGYILFGEQIGNTHPYEKERIDNLLKISLLDKYEFNNKEGNDVLNAFFDASDSFINILYGKMINGKLHHTQHDQRADIGNMGSHLCGSDPENLLYLFGRS